VAFDGAAAPERSAIVLVLYQQHELAAAPGNGIEPPLAKLPAAMQAKTLVADELSAGRVIVFGCGRHLAWRRLTPSVGGEISHPHPSSAVFMSDSSLTILLIEENPVRAAILEDGMRQAGYSRIVRIADMVNLPDKICAVDPDVVVIGLENACRDTLEQMFQVSRTVRRPIAMFVDNDDTAMIQASVDAGVSAYVVNCLSKARVRPIIDITISRFHAFRRLQEELARAKEALEARKVIERAKGILMQQHCLSEEEAYKMMRRAAMSQKRKLYDIAQSVVTAAQLLTRI